MTKKYSKIMMGIGLAALMTGCAISSNDEDSYRAGAVKLQLNELVTDRLKPIDGDEIDWKRVFLPEPGEITVELTFDYPKEIFDVEVGIYDRFGIPIKIEKRKSAETQRMEVRAPTPEGGLHYIKLSAATGKTPYSMKVSLDASADVYVAPDAPPAFTQVYESSDGGGDKGGKNNAPEPAGNNSNNGGGGGDSGGEGILLPSASAGGVVLPGGASGFTPGAAPAQSGPTIVKDSPKSSSSAPATVKTIESKGSAVTTEKKVKPIVSDIKDNFVKIEADITSVSPKKQGAVIKLKAGSKQGVNEGSVGDIYVNGAPIEGGRFKVTKIFNTSCEAETNASADDVKKANKFVIKSPQ